MISHRRIQAPHALQTDPRTHVGRIEGRDSTPRLIPETARGPVFHVKHRPPCCLRDESRGAVPPLDPTDVSSRIGLKGVRRLDSAMADHGELPVLCGGTVRLAA